MSQQSTPTKRERRDAARAQRLAHEQTAAAGSARGKRLTQLGALLAAAVVIVVAAIAISSGGSSGKSSGAGAGGSLQGVAGTKSLLGGIPQKGITLGNATAPVTIVEFADPQCPFCKAYTLNEMPALVEKYVRTGKAKMELRLLSFIGPDSVTAAGVLTAAGRQDKLWNATDLFYRNQGEENTGYVTDAFLTEVLTGAGADAAKAIAGAGVPAVSQELAAAKTLSSRYDLTGTPTVLVGPTGGDLKKSGGAGLPTAAGVGKQVDAALAAKGGR
jgi:protein-disulfide isomerase